MSLLSKLMGGGRGGPAPEPEPEVYKDCRIFAEPANEGGKYRLGARIEKDMDGETKTHTLIRADIFEDRAAAESAALVKARPVIDEQGDRLFD